MTFIHDCQNGFRMVLACDLSTPLPRITCDTPSNRQPAAIVAELDHWKRTVVVPALMRAMTPAQLRAMAISVITALE